MWFVAAAGAFALPRRLGVVVLVATIVVFVLLALAARPGVPVLGPAQRTGVRPRGCLLQRGLRGGRGPRTLHGRPAAGGRGRPRAHPRRAGAHGRRRGAAASVARPARHPRAGAVGGRPQGRPRDGTAREGPRGGPARAGLARRGHHPTAHRAARHRRRRPGGVVRRGGRSRRGAAARRGRRRPTPWRAGRPLAARSTRRSAGSCGKRPPTCCGTATRDTGPCRPDAASSEVWLEATNDRPRSRTGPAGSGLLGMAERLRAVGGRVRTDTDGQRFTLRVEVAS